MHLAAESTLPTHQASRPLLALVLAEQRCSVEWRFALCHWLLEQGCSYLVAWGVDCSSWDDDMDMASLEVNGFAVPAADADLVMTSWLGDAPMVEALQFARQLAEQTCPAKTETWLLHIASNGEEQQVLNAYAAA